MKWDLSPLMIKKQNNQNNTLIFISNCLYLNFFKYFYKTKTKSSITLYFQLISCFSISSFLLNYSTLRIKLSSKVFFFFFTVMKFCYQL